MCQISNATYGWSIESVSIEGDGNDLGTEYILDLLNRFELTLAEHKSLYDYCQSIGVHYMCTPWDKRSLGVLEESGVIAYKVASADLTNLPLMRFAYQDPKALDHINWRMSQKQEVQNTVNLLNDRHADYVLLHCNSTYPAPFQDINLRWLHAMKDVHPLIGYSWPRKRYSCISSSSGDGRLCH